MKRYVSGLCLPVFTKQYRGLAVHESEGQEGCEWRIKRAADTHSVRGEGGRGRGGDRQNKYCL